jgi:predicted O-methyltransferase YrrM
MITKDILEKLAIDSKRSIEIESLEGIVNRQEDASLQCPGIEAHYYRFFYRLAELIKPEFTLELGTHTGISAACLATGNPEGLVVTINNKQQLNNECRRDNIIYLIQDSLTKIVQNKKIDILFIDTDHDGIRCMEEYKLYKDSMAENGIIFFDDIYLLDCMKTFWNNFIPAFGKKFELNVHGTAGMGVILL